MPGFQKGIESTENSIQEELHKNVCINMESRVIQREFCKKKLEEKIIKMLFLPLTLQVEANVRINHGLGFFLKSNKYFTQFQCFVKAMQWCSLS